MESSQNGHSPNLSLPLRIVRFIVGAAWYLAICSFILAFFMLIFAPGKLNTSFDAKVPIHVTYYKPTDTYAEHPLKLADDRLAPVEVTLKGHTETIISFHSSQNPLSQLIALPVLLIFTGVSWTVYQLRCILQVVAAGRPFDREISRRLRHLAYLVFAAWPLNVALDQWVTGRYYGAVRDQISTDLLAAQIHLGAISLDLTWPFAGLMILIVAQIFEEGARLWEEQQLTV